MGVCSVVVLRTEYITYQGIFLLKIKTSQNCYFRGRVLGALWFFSKR